MGDGEGVERPLCIRWHQQGCLEKCACSVSITFPQKKNQHLCAKFFIDPKNINFYSVQALLAGGTTKIYIIRYNNLNWAMFNLHTETNPQGKAAVVVLSNKCSEMSRVPFI